MDENCSVYRTMSYLSKKWTVMILLELYKGDRWKRFSEIKRSMKKITPKMLSERLETLVTEGIVEKRVNSGSFPVRSEYRLTEMGRDLMGVVSGVKTWTLKWKVHNPQCASQDCIVCML